MNCETAIDRYLLLDKYEHVPFRIALHLLFCRKCRQEVILLAQAEQLIAEPLAKPVTAAEAGDLMRKIRTMLPEVNVERASSFTSWIIAGIAMVLCICVSPLLPGVRWLFSTSGTAFLLPLYLVLGITLAIYCGLFIATHQDFFIKKFDLFETTAGQL